MAQPIGYCTVVSENALNTQFYFNANCLILYLGNDMTTMLRNIADQEQQAVQSLILEGRRQHEEAILNRISFLKQDCICYLFCTGKKYQEKKQDLIWTETLTRSI